MNALLGVRFGGVKMVSMKELNERLERIDRILKGEEYYELR